MKKRLIERQILYNERLARCGLMPSVLFGRLILGADDCGRCSASATVLKGLLFPMDEEVTPEMIEEWLIPLVKEKLICLYTIGNGNYLYLTGWNEHQKLRYKSQEYPSPVEDEAETAPVNNNIISNFKEDVDVDVDADAEKDQSLSLPPKSPPSPSPAKKARAATTSGNALGGVGEKESNERFERFWRFYPRKIKKHEARRVFLSLRVGEDLLSQIVEAIERQKVSEQWTREGGRYIPSPVAWLRGRRWEDEPPGKEREGSFDTDDFFMAALNKSFQTRRND